MAEVGPRVDVIDRSCEVIAFGHVIFGLLH
jgi:hypothetical protein